MKHFCLIVVIYWGLYPSVLANNEVDALITVKNNLSDPNGVLQTWNASNATPCLWKQVTCDQNSVTKIYLGDASLSGVLSPQIGQLKNLVVLEFYGNDISGPIPSEIGNLAKLQKLDLYFNNFSGQIPSSLGNLLRLQYLRLNNNSLSGDIPASLTALSDLQVLDLSTNDLSGEVPSNGSFLHFTPLSFANNPSLQGKSVESPCFLPYVNCKNIFPEPAPEPPSPAPAPALPPPSANSPSHAVIGLISVIGAVTLGFASFGFWWFLYRRRQKYSDNIFEIQLAEVRFSLRELQVATDDFCNNNILGRGGSGKVYKGSLTNGSLVAVKRLNQDSILSNLQDFKNEIETFRKLEHRNLLPLLGFCVTSKERLLVYPFMANGSLHSCLQAHTPLLDWQTRKRIALDSARALAYLHHHCSRKIIHCDIKAANILLDDQLQAFVGDFGLATVMDHKNNEVITSVRGTLGHIAPEYLSSGILSDKVDVYAYGITLLELVTGQGPFSLARLAHDRDIMLLHWVSRLVEMKQLEVVTDPDLRENYNDIESDVEPVVQLAMLCTQQSPANRPTMSDVVRMLENYEGINKRWLDWRKEESEEVLSQEKDARYLLLGLNSQSAIELSGPR